MQDDSNGEFEIIDKQFAESPTVSNSLTNVAPPAALPSFITSGRPSLSTPTALITTSSATSLLNSAASVTFPWTVQINSPSVTVNTDAKLPPVTCQPHVSSSSQPDQQLIASGDANLPSVGIAGQGGPGWMGWIKGTVSSVSHKVAEKARHSMDTMITTLDPQMKEFICSGGDIEIIVASDKEAKIGPVRDAFQSAFGRATVRGLPTQVTMVASQPVGFAAALRAAEERVNMLRASAIIHPQQAVVAVENFLVELTPDHWFDMGLLLLDDPSEDILLTTYTQTTPVPTEFVTQARSSTPDDYPLKDTGFNVTIGKIASEHLHVSHSEWHEALTSVSRRETLQLASRALARLYKEKISDVYTPQIPPQ